MAVPSQVGDVKIVSRAKYIDTQIKSFRTFKILFKLLWQYRCLLISVKG